jgi:Outer membrane protein beta-barrel domain
MRILFVCFSFILFFTQKGISQTKAPAEAKPDKIYVSSYAAPAFVLGASKEKISSGFQAMTGIEYNFNQKLAIIGELNFDTYNYKDKGPTYALEGSGNFIPLSISLRYFLNKSKLAPYIRAGGGVARISLPTVNVDNGFTTIGSASAFVGQVQASVGVNYMLKPQYHLFAEVAGQNYGKSKLLGDQSLSLIAIRVGIRTPL